ncbi:hypothetical protein Scep_007056 [Stephania cephalantha]|uniref:Uncharacterized protein n=1 Tax=Stephania cephalantha TaxID=152367 RepID=A0AAP0PMU8_9MAGN
MRSRTSLAVLPRLEVLASHERTQRTSKNTEWGSGRGLVQRGREEPPPKLPKTPSKFTP